MITIENLHVTYRSHKALHHAVCGVNLTVGQGEFYTLLGPSGCGKTTTLRTVAGLEHADSGRIIVGDVVVCNPAAGIFVAPNERDIGMVFQSYAIWPHMTVFDNAAFPLRYIKPRPSAAVIRERVRNALSLVKLDGLEDRPAPFLSGGQQQRLALARSLVSEPKALLLDEPLSNLDAKLRDEMRHEISDLVKRLNITTLFVTHEQVEALTMSDRIGLMRDGMIVQQGQPDDLYNAPKEQFVSEFVGKTNVLRGTVVARATDTGSVTVTCEAGTLIASGSVSNAVGAHVLLAVRPESLVVHDAGQDVHGHNRITGTVKRVIFLGHIAESIVDVGGYDLRVQTLPKAVQPVGSVLVLTVAPEDVRILDGSI